jgi:SprT protein
MPKKEVPLDHLQKFLPEGTAPVVMDYLTQYKVHLTITRERKSILGDYLHRTYAANHRISVNGNLNPYSFLVTLLHEMAHLLTFEQFGNRVLAHGREWKSVYAGLLEAFLRRHRLPADIEYELKKSLKNPAASSCAEEGLIRVLRKYDQRNSDHRLVEEIPLGRSFKTPDGRVFIRGEKLRKRFKCREAVSGREYLFSPVYEVLSCAF